MQQLSQVGLSLAQFARQRKEEDARAGKINHLWSMNGVLVPVVQRGVHPQSVKKKKHPSNLKQFTASEQQHLQLKTYYLNGFERNSIIDAVMHEIV